MQYANSNLLLYVAPPKRPATLIMALWYSIAIHVIDVVEARLLRWQRHPSLAEHPDRTCAEFLPAALDQVSVVGDVSLPTSKLRAM